MTVISEHAISPARLRHALGHFATGVTVITSVSAEGEPVGTTVSAVSSVSLDPPLVLVCLDRSSQTLAAICAHGAFAINILSEGQQRLSSNFARRGAAVSWDAVAHRRGHAGCPRLEGALAVLDCTLEQRLEGGDHEIVIGRVRELELSARERGPLLHYRGVYVSLAPA
jgi:3-hydroxy-9,10-secoandrosta-1,3,5(10)-triene-9,17-dione monooxygenase reductase component